MSSCYQGIPARLGDRGEVYLLADLAGEWGFLGGCMFGAPDGFTLWSLMRKLLDFASGSMVAILLSWVK